MVATTVLSEKLNKIRHNSRNYITLDKFVAKSYLPWVKARKSSWQVDERIARQHISGTFGKCTLSEIKSFEVEQWLISLRDKGLAPATCNRILAVFKSICAFAEKSGLIPSGASPARTVRKLKVYIRRERFLSDNEARVLMRELYCHDNQAAKVLQLLLLTGARKSEILKAKWENIDLQNRILTVPVAKGGKPRHILLCAEAVSIIKDLKRVAASPWVFPGRNPAKPLADVYNFWNLIRNKLGLDNVRIHDLRHTFASFVVNSGRSLYETQQLLGHADPRTTMRYAHLTKDVLMEAVEGVSCLIGGKKVWALSCKKLLHKSERVGCFKCRHYPATQGKIKKIKFRTCNVNNILSDSENSVVLEDN